MPRDCVGVITDATVFVGVGSTSVNVGGITIAVGTDIAVGCLVTVNVGVTENVGVIVAMFNGVEISVVDGFIANVAVSVGTLVVTGIIVLIKVGVEVDSDTQANILNTPANNTIIGL